MRNIGDNDAGKTDHPVIGSKSRERSLISIVSLEFPLEFRLPGIPSLELPATGTCLN